MQIINPPGGGSSVDLASPGPIGGTTPNTGAFTRLTVSPAADTDAITVAGATHTASHPTVSSTQTWNNVAVTFIGWLQNFIDTASAAGSLLMDLRVGGASFFAVRKDGALIVDSGGSSAGDIIRWGGATNRGMVAANNGVAFKNSNNEFSLANSPVTSGRGWGLQAGGVLGWAPGADASDVPDVGVARVNTDKLEVNSGVAGEVRDLALRQLCPDFTNTATVGAVTINKSAGRAIVGAGASSVVVTNSLVTTDSQVFCTIAVNDATATIKNCVAGAGSFTITLTAAATANSPVNFLVLNS